MPADLVTGDDLEDVASYVASVAGAPGIKGPQLPNDPGAQVFANNGCSGCHTLKAAGASGTTGPDLDAELPGQSAAQVRESIVDPSAEIVRGFPNVMPKNYEQVLSPQDLDALVQFLLKYAGNANAKGK
jgi:cytochrome c oxidase subunit 2